MLIKLEKSKIIRKKRFCKKIYFLGDGMLLYIQSYVSKVNTILACVNFYFNSKKLEVGYNAASIFYV